MTRDEFMEEAQKEIDQVLLTHKNRLMNLVMKAWAEGKKNAEVSGIEDIIKEAIEKIHQQTETQELLPHNIPITTPDIHFEHLLDWGSTSTILDGIPSACKTCSNHPSNGGSGICHCIMGITPLNC